MSVANPGRAANAVPAVAALLLILATARAGRGAEVAAPGDGPPFRLASAESRCLTVAPGECLRVTVAGSGADVVLIPGLFGSAFGFRQVIPRLLASGHRVIVVEPLGVGDSSRPARADYSLTAQADRIHAALQALGVKAAVVVAHSIGGSMAFRLAYRHPDDVSGVVSLEGGPAETVATPGFRLALKFAPLIKLFGGGARIRGKVRGMLVSRSGDPSWVTDEVVQGYTAGATRDLDATLDALAEMARSREPELLRPRLGALRCPVRLLLGGASHAGGPPEPEVQLLRQTVAFLTIDRVPGAGHFIHEEDPGAVVAAVTHVANAGFVAAADGK